ncbi:ABC transporter ATP-binding protein [Alkaliphilus peptidifermentans]|uniref:Putative ABC transport system ATP-binding protein n=1 Tax=Alkaliphilus peptidifermentans DSM 18978 TaxID=1120976 RepID=A0A1G5E576_9FIRM|nr:ABC transporter ATP-binding protein [Alkaliphilus peptidifermentans]SCY21891.1 putative ABC transport system ATP-binding protein [Alkaliphilus peptidifermentans DSM 18978]
MNLYIDYTTEIAADMEQTIKNELVQNLELNKNRNGVLIMFLSTSNLTKSYNTGIITHVLKGVGLEMKRGEIGVILGPSGSGKSTLMNIIGGVDRADGGTVEVDGNRITDLNNSQLVEYRRESVGFIFQFYNLVPNLTVAENIEVVSNISKKPLKTDEMLSAVGLYDKKNRFPRELSGGEQQRVSIARAIVKNPKLLLCDEPTGALDLETSRGVLSLLQKVNEQFGTTILMITHNSAIAGMAQVVFRMRSGEVAEVAHNSEIIPAERIEW